MKNLWKWLCLKSVYKMRWSIIIFRSIWCWLWVYPLVNIQKTMENHHFEWENPLLMAISNSYIKLPEGTPFISGQTAGDIEMDAQRLPPVLPKSPDRFWTCCSPDVDPMLSYNAMMLWCFSSNGYITNHPSLRFWWWEKMKISLR